jgi:dihydroorotase
MNSINNNSLRIPKIDDAHLHVRQGEALKAVINHSAKQCYRAWVMPNLKNPIVSVKQALDYRTEILNAVDERYQNTFHPLMTLYLTNNTTLTDIHEAIAIKNSDNPWLQGVKMYPAGGTTNAHHGISFNENNSSPIDGLSHLFPIFEAMQEGGLPLLLHGEITTGDIFEKEQRFIEQILTPLQQRFKKLKISLEHITTAAAVDYVLANDSIVATITPQHLLHNRNAIFQGGIRPHYYCLPILKKEQDRIRLLEAATSGNPKFFVGTDSAPHAKSTKENACGCAGCFTGLHAIELYLTAFANEENGLEKFIAFSSHFAADFYQLPRNTAHFIEIERHDWIIPQTLEYLENDILVPFMSQETLHWKVK